MIKNDEVHVVCPQCGGVNRASRAKLAEGKRPDCGACGTRLFDGAIDVADDAAFARHVRRTSLPILVDFWAEWCGPCKVMTPQFVAAAKRLETRARFLKANTEILRETAATFRHSFNSNARLDPRWPRSRASGRRHGRQFNSALGGRPRRGLVGGQPRYKAVAHARLRGLGSARYGGACWRLMEISAMVIPSSTSRKAWQAFLNRVAKPADVDQRASVGLGIETFDQIEAVLGLADDLPDRDRPRVLASRKPPLRPRTFSRYPQTPSW